MCVDHSMNCSCGWSSASFNFKEEILPAGVVSRLYCPKCSAEVVYDPGTMLKDNAWIIQFDMDIARFAGQRLTAGPITPEFLFDEGYCTWRGVYPTDHTDSVREREELAKLAKINQKEYIRTFTKWGIDRMARLGREGWRKARETA